MFQTMHHGTTVVHWDAVAGSSRSARVFLRLERNCSTLTWRKATWSALKRSSSGPSDYSLKSDSENSIPNSLLNRPSVSCTSVVGKCTAPIGLGSKKNPNRYEISYEMRRSRKKLTKLADLINLNLADVLSFKFTPNSLDNVPPIVHLPRSIYFFNLFFYFTVCP